ncbi:MAG TPA: LysE family translocator [Vicinamibacteria bacterium]|nr:LysE family translocator [Vicinamibacteria bacterium]
MTTEMFAAYVVACVVLLFIPGPTILLVVSYALSQGRRSAMWTITGVILGDAVAMAVSLLGLGALLLASASLFAILKTVGALYLVHLGVKMWRKPSTIDANSVRAVEPGRTMALDAFTVTVLNPKSGLFFVAFLPQFMNRNEALVPQAILLGVTFLALAFVSVTLYALLASEARDFFIAPSASKILNRISGGALVGAGVFAAATR